MVEERFHDIRVRQLPLGTYAIEMRKYPWNWWKEEQIWPSRTSDKEEAMRRARLLMTANVVATKEQIMEPSSTLRASKEP